MRKHVGGMENCSNPVAYMFLATRFLFEALGVPQACGKVCLSTLLAGAPIEPYVIIGFRVCAHAAQAGSANLGVAPGRAVSDVSRSL